jgi:hypothetical protein
MGFFTKGNQVKIEVFDDELTERLTCIKMLKPHFLNQA